LKAAFFAKKRLNKPFFQPYKQKIKQASFRST